MLVDVLMRSNFRSRFGGDSVQVDKYREHLGPRGVDFRLVPSEPGVQLRPGAIAHVVNMDRTYEFLAATEVALKNGRALLSSIHHSSPRILVMDEQRSGFQGLVSRTFRDPATLEWTKQAARFRGRHLGWFAFQPRSAEALRRVTRDRLRAMGKVLVLGEGEYQDILDDFGFSAESSLLHSVIPNGVEVDPRQSIEGNRDIDVLLAGRVEERKNQWRVLESLRARTDLKIVVVGAMAARSNQFKKNFFQLIESSKHIEYLGPRHSSELPELYSRSKVLVNASYVEVLSLVEIEALAYGCHLIGCWHGHTKEYFSDLADFMRAEDVKAQLTTVLDRVLGQPWNAEAASRVRENFTWASAADKLMTEYEQVA